MAAINPYTSIQPSQRPEPPVANAERDVIQRDIRPAPPREAASAAPPVDLRERLGDLITKEVSDGRLTGNQADDLRNVFNEAFSAFAALPTAKLQGIADVADSPLSIDKVDASRLDTAGLVSAKTDIEGTATVMQRFLDALQASLDSSAAATYGASGQNNVAAIKTVPPLLVDYRT